MGTTIIRMMTRRRYTYQYQVKTSRSNDKNVNSSLVTWVMPCLGGDTVDTKPWNKSAASDREQGTASRQFLASTRQENENETETENENEKQNKAKTTKMNTKKRRQKENETKRKQTKRKT